ncbi:MAG: DNA polymerase IV [Oculatellaceae cyanobacterium Prado106]|jgi:DNA polymerase-4|nr:DNA polymerase IV [Oculatellaceae cyanobacterium Prado106]
MDAIRKIIHIDMDAFYASVEQRDEPRYRGKPLVVGGLPQQRGVVAAASYEARKFGIHSAMPSRTAYQKCPTLIFVKPRFEVYHAVSRQIREIFHRYTDQVEPLALDEAYLDVTQNKQEKPSATLIAQEIKAQILQETGLTASAGISINKFLAKVASGFDKPNGLYLIPPDAAVAFVETLPIEKFHGIGQVTAARMHELGIHTGKDLKQWTELDLVAQFGKVGHYYYKIARAQDDRPVEPNRIRRSIGAENSFAEDLGDRTTILTELEQIAQLVLQRLTESKATARTLTLKVKYADYQQITRSRTLTTPIQDLETILKLTHELLAITEVDRRNVRLLGITLSNLTPNNSDIHYQQLTLSFKQGFTI